MRAVETEADVARLAAFNGRIHEDEVAVLTQRLLLDHPRTSAHQWLVVEEQPGGRFVSSLCLIPWTWRLEGVELRCGEMGIVGTEPEYRHRGLVRALVGRYDRLLRDEAFDLTHIQGIPGFYGQFGYQYAIALIPDLRLPLDAVPAQAGAAGGLGFRPATFADIPALEAAYARLVRPLALSAERGEAVWRYLVSGQTANEGETWCIEGAGGGVVGYFRTHRRGFGRGLIVSEVSPLPWRESAALLAELVRRARAADKPYVKLEVDPQCGIAAVARSLGAQAMRTYAWQIRVVDLAGLLRKLAPVLERRLEASLFAGLSERFVLSLYREAFALDWEGGRLASVSRIEPPGTAAAALPPEVLVPLVLGHRSLAELAGWHPDVRVEPRAAALLDALFPKLPS
jgi:predicted N-acetyltransferase YhbS